MIERNEMDTVAFSTFNLILFEHYIIFSPSFENIYHPHNSSHMFIALCMFMCHALTIRAPQIVESCKIVKRFVEAAAYY